MYGGHEVSKVLGEIADTKHRIVSLLGDLPAQNRRRAPGGGTIYVLESYECEIDNSGSLHYTARNHAGIAVQVSDQVRLGDDVCLIVYEGHHRIEVAGYRNRSAVPHIEEYWAGDFPHFEIKWGDGPSNSGKLVFVRVDFSGSEFANVENYSGKGFEAYRNGRYDQEPGVGQPKSVEDVEKLLGQAIARKIDCEARAVELLEQCGLKALLREVNDAVSLGASKM